LADKKHENIKISGFKRITPFAKKVHKVVLSIPMGQVLKRNPWPLIVSCHRVICANGRLGGYSSGQKKKKTILDLEKQIRKYMV